MVADRKWQIRCLDRLNDEYRKKHDFLCVATPGGGKTKLALAFAQKLIRESLFDHIHVVSPTQALRNHWIKEAAAFGIRLTRRPNATLRMKELPFDISGVASTYSQVAADADAHAAAIHNHQALVVLDECHHSGDRKAWGESVKEAFDMARFRLHLSGTPFRMDGNVIPFIKYKSNGECDEDFEYSYSEALADDVCRPVGFEWINAEIAYRAGGRDWLVQFTDDLNADQESERLRYALHAESGLVEQMIIRADKEISSLRSRGHRFADTAGLLVAMNQAHAYDCAQIIERVSGEVPAVVVSDSASADDDLEAFRDGMGRWIVAVRMITEGVDIPRLMTAVYATNVVSTLFFRQFVGRVCRVRHRGAREMASVYMLADERLKMLATEIENAVQQFVSDNPGRHPEAERRSKEAKKGKMIEAPVGRVTDSGNIIHGVLFTPEEIEQAREYGDLFIESEFYSPLQLAHLLFSMRERGLIVPEKYSGGRRVHNEERNNKTSKRQSKTSKEAA